MGVLTTVKLPALRGRHDQNFLLIEFPIFQDIFLLLLNTHPFAYLKLLYQVPDAFVMVSQILFHYGDARHCTS